MCYHLYERYLQLYTRNKPNSRVQSVSAVMYWQFVLMLLRWLNMFCTFTLVISEVRVQYPIWLFSVVQWFRAFPLCCPGIVWWILRWFVALVIPSITFDLTFHMRWISIANCYCYCYCYAIISRSNVLFPQGATAPSGPGLLMIEASRKLKQHTL